uniref:protoporphyrinogen oxidase n=1 Tax=Streptomyces xiaopingdaonensis TaxID=1565415 RepID=UPI00038232AA
DRLVEPLLGGVYAGDAYRISMRAAVPQLYEAARQEPSLLAAVRAVQRESRRAAERAEGEQPPAFLGIRGGLGRLPQAVADACRAAGAEVRTGSRVRRLERAADGWGAVVEGPEGERSLTADAVVVAAPAPAAAELLRAESPGAAAELAAYEYASMALVTMAFRRREVSLPAGSGFLVPPVDGRSIKAATFSGSKWRWVAEQAPELTLVRTSLGRHGEERVLERDDAELAALARADLAAAAGITAEPVDTLVTRWDAGLPQYPSGHQARVGRIRAALGSVPRLALCGAALDGVGIPACAASGRSAADQALAEAGQSSKREGRESHV